MIERRMTPIRAIQSGTSVATDHMGSRASLGQLRKGFNADIIAVTNNPLANIDTLYKVPIATKEGRDVKDY